MGPSPPLKASSSPPPSARCRLRRAFARRRRPISPRGSRPVFASDLRGPIAILIGGEGPGLAPSQLDAADELVMIPMEPPVESLNTAVSAALIVYEARRQRTLNLEP